MSTYLDADQTKRIRNFEMVSPYDVAKFLVEHQGTPFQSRDLCEVFYYDRTDSHDTLMRQAIELVTNDRIFEKIIIATPKGFMHPFESQNDLVGEYRAKLEKMARSLFYRASSIKYKQGHDEQIKEQLGEYDSPVFQAFLKENDMIVEALLEEEKAKKELLLAKKVKRQREADIEESLVIPAEIGAQVGMRL